jgi:hypothetical protein
MLWILVMLMKMMQRMSVRFLIWKGRKKLQAQLAVKRMWVLALMKRIVYSRYWICTGAPGAFQRLHWTGLDPDPGSSSNPIQQDHWSKRAAGEAHPTDKLTDETLIGEETVFVDEVPTAAKASERRYCKEVELDELASAEESAVGDETIINDQGFEDAASYKSLADDCILEGKQGDGRTFYSTRGTVTVKMNLWELPQNIKDKELLDVWRRRKI